MDMLLTSLVMLAIGPALVRLCAHRVQVLRVLDAFVLVTIAGLVLLHLIPESLMLAGWWALAAAGFGLVLPVATHRAAHHSAEHGLGTLLPFALVGLVVHAFIDGIALSEGGHAAHGGTLLTLGVVLHRLPMGMAVWWIVEPRIGARAALGTLVALIAATIGGFFTAGFTALGGSGLWLGVIQALVAGSLLHVVQHHAPSVTEASHEWSAPAVGGALGFATIAVLSVIHPATEHFGLGGSRALWLAAEIAAALILAAALVATSRRGAHRHTHNHRDSD